VYLAIADEAKQRGIAEVAPEVGIREVQPISELLTFSVG
jgi:hypothetical protein